jgi:hypothetical protein
MSLSEPGLDREEADRALERLGAESDRIAEALVAMDGHPGHQLLRGASLAGSTQRRWAETSTAMATLWEQFEAYRTLLEQARSVRARKGRPGQAELDELTELLTGKVVVLNQQQVPIEQRGLTGPAMIVERVSLNGLVTMMKDTFSKVTEVLAGAQNAWETALARLDPLDTELRSALQRSELLGAPLPALERIRTTLAEVRATVAADPLGADPAPLAELEGELKTVRAELADLEAARDSYDLRVADIQAVLTRAVAAQNDAHEALRLVLAKIARPGVSEVRDFTAGPRSGLTTLAQLFRGAEWPRLATELDRLERGATAALSSATTQLRTITGLLERRAELRGRLDAYRAKASRLGRAEDLHLSALHTEAYDLLYTSPTDLAAATRAVNRYQQAVQEGPR